jgi:hypothetical protein
VVEVANPQHTDLWVPWAFVLLLLGIAIDMKFGIYACIEGHHFHSVSHFLVNRRTAIADIERILYQPTWIIGKKQRSIYLIERSGKVWAKMANTAYSKSTLVEVVNDLKRINPSISLDRETEELVADGRR